MQNHLKESDEIWKWIPGYERYQASNLGRIKSFVRFKNGYILQQFKDKKEYLRVTLSSGISRSNKRKQFLVHRLILITFCGPPKTKHEGSHLNGNRSDNRLKNLRWMIHIENEHLKILHQTNFIGERNPRAILTEENVKEIRQRLSNGEIQKNIAEDFDISQSHISHIHNHENWSHVK